VLILRPKSKKNETVEEFIEPKVSRAIGWKRWDWERSAYLADFRLAASTWCLSVFLANQQQCGRSHHPTRDHRPQLVKRVASQHYGAMQLLEIWHDLDCFPNQLRLWLGPAKHPVSPKMTAWTKVSRLESNNRMMKTTPVSVKEGVQRTRTESQNGILERRGARSRCQNGWKCKRCSPSNSMSTVLDRQTSLQTHQS